eukprot:2482004-Pyramimonas_sp.AAC.1
MAGDERWGEGNAPHHLLLGESRKEEGVNRSLATALDEGGLSGDLLGHIMRIKIQQPPRRRPDH